MSAGTTYQTAGEGRPRRGDPNRRSPRICLLYTSPSPRDS